LRSVDYRTDLYSLGMVAFNALSGKYAFSGESFGDLLLGICTLPLPVLHEVAPWLPPVDVDLALSPMPDGRAGRALTAAAGTEQGERCMAVIAAAAHA